MINGSHWCHIGLGRPPDCLAHVDEPCLISSNELWPDYALRSVRMHMHMSLHISTLCSCAYQRPISTSNTHFHTTDVTCHAATRHGRRPRNPFWHISAPAAAQHDWACRCRSARNPTPKHTSLHVLSSCLYTRLFKCLTSIHTCHTFLSADPCT